MRHNWSKQEVLILLNKPFSDLIFLSQTVHRDNFNQNKVQLSTLVNVKTGGCPEDCAYCPQSAHHKTSVKAQKILQIEDVVSKAKQAKKNGATRFCMGAAWRHPKDSDIENIIDMVREVKKIGMETCVTLGMLTKPQTIKLKTAGLDYYNHNIDTSPEFYTEIISTRDYQDRLDTINYVREVGINVCSGGIVGMGETKEDRAIMLLTLANMPSHPKSVPINMLVKVEGTPLNNSKEIDPIDFIRIIATARIMMPTSYVRLSAGRSQMTDEMQALCFIAGANSIFYGEKLLTTENPQIAKDINLLERLGLEIDSP